MSRKDTLAAGGKSATYNIDSTVSQQRWDYTFLPAPDFLLTYGISKDEYLKQRALISKDSN